MPLFLNSVRYWLLYSWLTALLEACAIDDDWLTDCVVD